MTDKPPWKPGDPPRIGDPDDDRRAREACKRVRPKTAAEIEQERAAAVAADAAYKLVCNVAIKRVRHLASIANLHASLVEADSDALTLVADLAAERAAWKDDDD